MRYFEKQTIDKIAMPVKIISEAEKVIRLAAQKEFNIAKAKGLKALFAHPLKKGKKSGLLMAATDKSGKTKVVEL